MDKEMNERINSVILDYLCLLIMVHWKNSFSQISALKIILAILSKVITFKSHTIKM